MPKGYRLMISGDQINVVRACVQSGLKARGILRLNHQALKGLNEGALQRIIRREGLVDPVCSQRLRGAHRLPAAQKEAVLAYLLGPGKNLPDSLVARRMGVNMRSVFWLRFTRIGKVHGPRRISQEINQERRRKVSRYYAEQRAKLYESQCALQSRLEADYCTDPLKKCSVCGHPWFATAAFFYRTSRKRPGGRNFSGACIICTAEMGVLRRLGKGPEEILQSMKYLIWQKPAKTAEELFELFRQDSTRHCMDPLVRCETCSEQWYQNSRYFHVRDRKLLGICLACPAKRSKRKFFFIGCE